MPTRRILLSSVAILATLLLLSPDGAAQRTTDLEERARVEYVLLDVLAFDRNGLPVTGLSLDDFVVLENRKRVKLDSLEILDLRAPKDGGAAESEATGNGRGEARRARSLQVIVIDLGWVGAAEARKTFDQLERFLESAPADGNVAFKLYDMDHGPLIDDYTPDPSVLLAELRRHRSRYAGDEDHGVRVEGHSGRDERGSFIGTTNAAGAEGDLVALEARLDTCRSRDDMLGAMAKASGSSRSGAELFQCIQGELRVFLDGLYARTEVAITNLESLARRFGNEDVPVSILMVSPGFSLEAGRAAIDLAQVYYDRARRVDDPEAREQPGMPERLTAFGAPRSYKKEFVRVVHACLAHRVTFHTFDIYNFNLGLDRKADARLIHGSQRMEGVHRTFRSELEEGLVELAEKSGGFFHPGSTLRPMGTVVERSRYVYTLGYASPGGAPGKFRKIKVKSKRKGVKLRHRGGYYGTAN